MVKKIFHSLWLFIYTSFMTLPSLATSSNLMLLETYHNQDLQGWVMSEKLDGIRGYWDGTQLFSRQNQILTPPHYFIRDFPPFAIDGELFSQRNQFEHISSVVRSQKDKGWEKVKLYVFDVPNANGNLFERLAILEQYLAQHPTPYIQIIPQIPIESKQQVMDYLAQVESQKGEGLVLRNPQAAYEPHRSSQILKLKTALDEECTVIAHHPGQGKFQHMLGSLTCENQRGTFKIGSGFNLQERQNPPPIGTVITYKYRGLTQKGLPRFATYWRQRTDLATK
ncbi:DNA ligase [Actinobacillus seminis]|uniref:DNA ligase n=1 Tax=Actinobacillus seminis TaxID=722 RepID=A0A263HBC4_9PAST|nr:DNA ligase [Actinobacillus seminis]OZN24785.1 DNA ligase [Actinobacillus seminis]SUU35280.1 DNA ligase [Actinobacillus seminis]